MSRLSKAHGMWLQMQDGILQTVGLPAGSMMFHPAGVVHFDGAINGPTEIQIIGMGPVSTTSVYPNEGRFGKPRKLN